jgi:hypothetical protein
MKIGFSLSPGGLLLPYHAGALHCLQKENVIDSSTLVAGSSAGSIAAMAHGCGVHPYEALEGTINISETCRQKYGRAHGKLLNQLQHHMERLVGDEEFEHLQHNANIGIGYTQIFPRPSSHVQIKFRDRKDLFQAVSYSCMFPFFTTDGPWLLDTSHGGPLPRLMVDGVFSVPWDRFGCPHLEDISYDVDRTVAISVLPRHLLRWCANGMGSFENENCISPSLGGHDSNHDVALHLIRIAAFSSSRRELTQVFEMGYRDAEIWCRQEEDRQRREAKRKRERTVK